MIYIVIKVDDEHADVVTRAIDGIGGLAVVEVRGSLDDVEQWAFDEVRR